VAEAQPHPSNVTTDPLLYVTYPILLRALVHAVAPQFVLPATYNPLTIQFFASGIHRIPTLRPDLTDCYPFSTP